MSKPRILLQLDPDRHASAFDAVVAIDAAVDQLLQYTNVQPDDVPGLVHGAMFTRGPADLKQTAIFIGGSKVEAGEVLLDRVTRTFFGPLRVSVMLDANGANTTAAAAVVAAGRHLPLAGAQSLVLAGTGPVGQRVVRLLARQGAHVRVGSRDLARSQSVCDALSRRLRDNNSQLTACQTDSLAATRAAMQGVALVIAAGAAGVELLARELREKSDTLRVAIDLNAVPPVGITGIGVTDAGKQDGTAVCYGAIGVGATKMKIHKAALQRLFASNTLVLDAEEIFELGQRLEVA